MVVIGRYCSRHSMSVWKTCLDGFGSWKICAHGPHACAYSWASLPGKAWVGGACCEPQRGCFSLSLPLSQRREMERAQTCTSHRHNHGQPRETAHCPPTGHIWRISDYRGRISHPAITPAVMGVDGARQACQAKAGLRSEDPGVLSQGHQMFQGGWRDYGIISPGLGRVLTSCASATS